MALRHQKDIHLIKSTAESPLPPGTGQHGRREKLEVLLRLPNFLATAKYCANPAGELSHIYLSRRPFPPVVGVAAIYLLSNNDDERLN
mmetsp:Transcript_37155/g.75795  ORF Transcript_37155/g.75795 Transcript_37155/m.75795 type:complete len:88 (+) Transcript_37155:1395-1658(+)